MKNDYEIRGCVTAIFLRRKDGTVLETLIDTEDLENVKKFPNTWYAWLDPKTDYYYVFANGPAINGKRKGERLHRYLFCDPKGKHIDHINHNTLCNLKSNLRVVSCGENQQNRAGSRKDNKTSGVRGVHWDKHIGKWRVQMQIKGKKKHIGVYDDKQEAKIASEAAYSKFMPYSEHSKKVSV